MYKILIIFCPKIIHFVEVDYSGVLNFTQYLFCNSCRAVFNNILLNNESILHAHVFDDAVIIHILCCIRQNVYHADETYNTQNNSVRQRHPHHSSV